VNGLALNNRLLAVGGGAKPAAASSEGARDDAEFTDVLGAVNRGDVAAPARSSAAVSTSADAKAPRLRFTLGFPIARGADIATAPAAPREPASIESTLASLGYDASPSSVEPTDARSKPRGHAESENAAPESSPALATTTTPPSIPMPFPITPMATAAPNAVKRAAPILAAAAVVARGPPTPQTAAADSSGWDLSGAVPLRSLLASDPTLGLQSLQSRTHLAVANAIPIRASAAAVPASSKGAETSADEAAPPLVAAPPSPAPDAGGSASVSLPGLPRFVADQATEFAPPSTSAPAPAAPKAPTAVKELEIAMDPADLGAVTLKMRLANGKLSVTIAAAKPSTLATIEGQRSAIADRLSASQLAPEDLIIQSRAESIPHAETADAVDPNANPSDTKGQPDQPRRDGAYTDGREERPRPGAPARADFGDLIV
jgi:hypothetical protein